jgi:RNA polymerase sigma-70 factor (ECF subfamily)
MVTPEWEARRASAFVALADGQLLSAYRLAAVLLGDPVEAQDATHDAVVVAWERFGSLREEQRFGAWFQRILVNQCRDRLRARRRMRRLPWASPEPARDVDPDLPERDALQRAIAGLAPNHRVVIVLRYFCDLTVEEIAVRTGEREGTVKSRLHYGLNALRAAYDAASRT